MRSINLPETVSPITAMQFQDSLESGTNMAVALTRLSQSVRVITPPKWAMAVALHQGTNGKHGMHALHLAPELLTALIAKGKASLGVCKLALAHPDRNQAGMFKTLVNVHYGKQLKAIENAPALSAKTLLAEIDAFLKEAKLEKATK